MKKEYNAPQAEIIEFNYEEQVVASGCELGQYGKEHWNTKDATSSTCTPTDGTGGSYLNAAV